ncbi:glutamate--cysteine ligase [Sandaracinobacter neustonicus]|uniref:Glutamate--cysteine ligase n=1 Tax=Sandaracinobacter neustonicus TaxID=1715348 RepID=A0A501XNX6_9SPHN|nr:glutamate--cysteine ligase [Sandaracinobacter neustonicus]TPE62155.1 glutamate--cysteine ligase [Sandaracinobacter neustonicus]
MSNKQEAAGDAAPIESKADLIRLFEAGEKPKADWRIGTEHEKFVFRLRDHAQPSWEEPNGIRDLLTAFGRYGWAPVLEGGKIIAATGADGSLSLEPAGQFELSGAALENLHQTCAETGRHREQCLAIGEELGLGFLGLGFNPVATREALPWMPKGRYAIMRRHMPRVGTLGLDMMQRTCTVQTNLDYGSEADMVKKFRVSLALQPLGTALFANSPFTEGKPNGYLSYRSHIWTDTDPARTGMLPFVFDEGFGYESYADYALRVPMYFAYRDGEYLDAAGKSFGDFIAGRLDILPGERATYGDWKDHLSTAFPEVRLKGYLEMRGSDSGPQSRICALPALWVGLLYDGTALDAAWDLVKGWSIEGQQRMRDEVPRLALKATAPDGKSLQALAKEVLAIAAGGLERRARDNGSGDSEAGFLTPLWEIATSGKTLAEHWLERFHGEWGGKIDPIWDEARF